MADVEQPHKLSTEVPEQPTKVTKAINKFLYVALVVIGIGIALFLYWGFQSPKIIEARNEPFPVRTIREHPTASGVVILNVDYCKYYNVEGDLRMSFLNSDHEVFMPIVREKGSKGCRQTEFPILIPNVIEPGKYKVKFRVTYDLNPLKQNIVNEFTSQEFEIFESEASQP